jgi:hypothetical protein
MPIFHVIVTKEYDLTIRAKSREELQKALETADLDDLGDGSEWSAHVGSELTPTEKLTPRPECAVVNGNIIDHDWDYLGDVALCKTPPIDPGDVELAKAELERRQRAQEEAKDKKWWQP